MIIADPITDPDSDYSPTPSPLDPDHPDPATSAPADWPTMPDWVTDIRGPQRSAVANILDAYDRGVDVVLLEAPTGTGKTLIAEMVRQAMADPRSLYVATTKSLQDQFARDFRHSRVLKGRANYPTLDDPRRFLDKFNPLSAADCQASFEFLPSCAGCPEGFVSERKLKHCLNCHPYDLCPYQIARRKALAADTAVVNSAYLLTEANGPGAFGRSDPDKPSTFPLIVADECDTLESILMGQVEIAISPQRRKKWGIGQPAKVTVAESWLEWVIETLDNLKAREKRVGAQVDASRQSGGGVDTKLRKEHEALVSMVANLTRLARALSPDADPATDPAWVYDPREHKKGWVKFRPVTVGQYGPHMLWRHAPRWLLMSASIISPDELVESLGLDRATRDDGTPLRWEVFAMGSDFPIENRPVHVIPGPKMTAKNAEHAEPIAAELVERIADMHPDDRILVHTVSYRLTDVLAKALRSGPHRRRVVTYTGSDAKEAALTTYLDTPGSIMLAPSLDRGTDLPGDACRVQVVAKVPFLFLDAQTQARLYGTGQSGQLWYDVAAIRTIVQMTGRGVRSSTDSATTYILDGSFLGMWSKRRILFPRWWKDAVNFEGVDELQRVLNDAARKKVPTPS